MRAFEAAPSIGEASSSDEESQRGAGVTTGVHRLVWVGTAVGVLLVVAGAALLASTGGGSADARVPRPAAVKRLGEKTNLNSDADPFSDEEAYMDAAGQVTAGIGGVPIGDALTQQVNETSSSVGSSPTSQSIEPANIQPGHMCAEYEENLAGLCYTKCSILAGPEYPHRGSPWTCCADSPCRWGAFKHGFGALLCTGYAVAGTAGKSCPHRFPSCRSIGLLGLLIKELFMNMCYKTCKELTDGMYPHRTAAATCCKERSTLSCMNPMNAKTRASFNVGGGKGDGDPNTPSGAHIPHTIES